MKHQLYRIKYLIGLIVLLTTISCSNDDPTANFEIGELQRLLAADSAKSWQRLTRRENGNDKMLPDCEKDELLIFSFAESADDSITFNYETGPSLCSGQSDSLIFQGAWDIVSNDLPEAYDSLRLAVDGDTSLRNIDFITSQILMLSFEEDVSGQKITVTESYGFSE